ncbi:FKBP12-associated protein [Acarospora aff. strigata]|nr:FKBP12-associated protein [Acarospora aff. strigata]
MRCNASKTSEGNSKKTLTCDDECARLARNRKLALALNIDPEAHKDDYVPYSTDTLKMFQENIKWAQTQERELRVFAADEAEKRLRFKPMQAHQRAFLHALAQDYGFDSESMDPEPHRHVAIFKTPRFVLAPMKTLAECVKAKPAVGSVTDAMADGSKKLNASNFPYNGFLLSHPRFGLTVEELRSDLSNAFASASSLAFDVSFLPSDEVVLKANTATKTSSDKDVQAALKSLKSTLSSIIAAKHLAAAIQLCTLDSSLNVLRREYDDANNGGWSQVAAKAAAPRRAPVQAAVGAKSVYTVLGSKMAEAKRKKEKEEKERMEMVVVDDWEEEVRKEEEAEKVASGGEEGTSTVGSAEEGMQALNGETLKQDSIGGTNVNSGEDPRLDSQHDVVSGGNESRTSAVTAEQGKQAHSESTLD